MLNSISSLKLLLEEVQGKSASEFAFVGVQLPHSKTNIEVVLTHVPGGGPGLLIFPTSKNIKNLKRNSLKGIEIKNVEAEINGGTKRSWLAILCRDDSRDFQEPFLGLALEILNLIDKAESLESPVPLISATLNRWHLFWSHLSGEVKEEWIKGLWGELYLLDFLIANYGVSSVICWMGPEGLDHDFQNAGTAIEVKTTERLPFSLKVNSINQLDNSLFKNLFLAVCLVMNDDRGYSITELSKRITVKLSHDLDALEIFWRKMATVGYRPFHEEKYNQYLYRLIDNIVWYRIDDSFPKITSKSFSNELDRRLGDVKYRVDLSGIAPIDYKLISDQLKIAFQS